MAYLVAYQPYLGFVYNLLVAIEDEYDLVVRRREVWDVVLDLFLLFFWVVQLQVCALHDILLVERSLFSTHVVKIDVCVYFDFCIP